MGDKNLFQGFDREKYCGRGKFFSSEPQLNSSKSKIYSASIDENSRSFSTTTIYAPTSTADFKNNEENQFLEDLKLFDDIANGDANLVTTTELIPTTTTNGFYESFTFTVAETLVPFSAVYESFDESLKAKTETSLLYESVKKSGDSSGKHEKSFIEGNFRDSVVVKPINNRSRVYKPQVPNVIIPSQPQENVT